MPLQKHMHTLLTTNKKLPPKSTTFNGFVIAGVLVEVTELHNVTSHRRPS